MRVVLALSLFLASFCFALGISLPLIEVKQLLVFTDEPSLVQIVAGLWTSDWLLAIVVGLFSIVFPAVKLAYLHALTLGAAPGHLHGALRALSNWSMLDVMLVAIVVFAAKTSGLASAVTQPGLWFFAASALLTALASALAKRLEVAAESAESEGP